MNQLLFLPHFSKVLILNSEFPLKPFSVLQNKARKTRSSVPPQNWLTEPTTAQSEQLASHLQHLRLGAAQEEENTAVMQEKPKENQ